MDYSVLTQNVVQLARETGIYIRNERERVPLSIDTKGKNDFVTQVDKSTEVRLVEGLRKLLPESGFIAEEATSTEKGDRYNWIVDPIDGTTNFIHGLYPYAISIALREDEELVIGVIYEVGLDECFYGYKGGKAFLNEKEICVSQRPNVADSLIATGFPYSDYKRLPQFMKSLEYFMAKSHGLRRLGSAATDLAYVACGRFDAFYEYNLNAWDVAAGVVIVRQAGGRVGDFSGGNDYLFGREIIASNDLIFDEFLLDVKRNMNS
jgi:myo-inositol-1(or 4)-monophosphatase